MSIRNFYIKIKKEKKRKKDHIQLLREHARLLEEDKEYKTLLLLQDPICGKHHG